jgi:hypothetical protein
VASNYSLEAFGWVADVVYHRVLYVAVPNDVRVGLVFAITLIGALFMLKAWFVEIDLLSHND